MNPGASLELRDIHLPGEPSWWPPAPGWWLLLLMVVLAVFLLGKTLRRALRRRRQRRELLTLLSSLCAQYPVESQPSALLGALSELLRRAAKRHAPHALALHDEAWLGFLDRGLADRPFATGVGRVLLDGPYRPWVDPVDVKAVVAVVQRRLQRFSEIAG